MTVRRWLGGALTAGAAFLVACSDDSGSSATPVAQATARATAAPSTPAAAATPDRPQRNADGTLGRLSQTEERIANQLGTRYPNTDFRKRTVDLSEIVDGGPGKDGGIPSLQDPSFVTQKDAGEWLKFDEPVVAVQVNGEARAYPIQILMWHEMANDTLGGVPIVVTFCPLCNTAITFDRRVDGTARKFGVSGLLRASDLIMYDRTNESLWQQITGEAIVGRDVGKRLTFLPSQIVSWRDFQQTYPDALVLSRNTGFTRNYGQNPYQGYDSIGSSTIFPVPGADTRRLDAKERVLTVEIGRETVAFPFSELAKAVVLTTKVDGKDVVAFWQTGTTSALDDLLIAGGRDVGSAGAFFPVVDGRALEFRKNAEGKIVDRQTDSVWNVLGRAVSGDLKGKQLEPVISANHFWFAWSVFKPETRIVKAN
ncbi:MAG: DUF3179 domain-containing protein [Chloroflexi bacterium]|nr:DUF3179 domain-containing protein [Chloroflexota bacterium]